MGGSETQETTYAYAKKWTGMPASSSNFKHPEGHENPTKTIENTSRYVSTATVGIYDIDLSKISLPAFKDIPINEQTVTTGSNGELTGNYIFIPQGEGFNRGTLTNPELGDSRVSYTDLYNHTNVTTFGKLNNGKITPFLDPENDNKSLYLMSLQGKDETVASLHTGHKLSTWLLRGLGFLMMWIGLSALFAPLSVILDVIPMLGSITGGIIKMITFFVALILSTVTIWISMLFNSLIAITIVTVILIGGAIFYLKKKQKN